MTSSARPGWPADQLSRPTADPDDPPRSRRVVAVLLTLVLIAALSACTGSSGASGPQAPSLAAARQVLASVAAAVRGHDRTRLLAALDPRRPGFRADQTTDYASLSRLPLRVWRYAVVGEIHDGTANRSAARRYGGPVLLVHVTLLYALRGVDVVAGRHDQYLVFTQRDGHTYLAGDDAGTGETLHSWVGPWRYGPLIAVPGARSLVLGPPDRRAQLQQLARRVDAGIAAVSAVWGTRWSQRVAAVVPASAAEYTALTGAAARETAAAAVTDGVDSGTGQPYGQRLVLDPTQLARLSAVGEQIVLAHEITHLATAADTADITPRWLVEGFAEYVANLHTGQPVTAAAGELRAAVRAGQVPKNLPVDAAFGASGNTLAQQYEQSWLACRLIAARAGRAGLLRFYRSIGTALAPRADAVAAAFRSVLHETERAFTVQWRAYLEEQLR
ncbi:MAG TPA: hypothetical protein VIG48_09940 [Jatrophihabitans sp.]|jgi:hypothetical protein